MKPACLPPRITRLAEKHCSNWCRGDLCVGTDVDLPSGRQIRWRSEGSRCLLADGKRCPYFEQSVLPMEDWQWKNPSEGTVFKNATHEYRIRLMTERKAGRAIRRCPNCRKNTVRPPAKFCDMCEADRRRAAHRASYHGSNSDISEQNDP